MSNNSHQKLQQQPQEILLKELNEFKDTRYGNVTLYINPDSEMYYTRKDKVFQSKKQVSHVVREINKRINHPNLYYVGPLTYEYSEIDSKSQANRKLPVLRLYMPYPEENLEDELKKRITESRPFDNREMTYMMYDLLQGFYHLQTLGFAHNRFGPEFVATTTTGFAILDDPMHYPFDVVNLKRRKEWYLSPEAYRAALLKQKAGKDYDLIKSDVFSFGLVLLEAGLQMNVNEIYGQPGELKLDEDTLEGLIQMLKSRYPDNNLVVSTVRKMLTIDPEMRPDFKEMISQLPPYEMIQSYFEKSHQMTEKERQSMRESIHGQSQGRARRVHDVQEFARKRPETEGQRMKASPSIKRSTYIEEMENFAQNQPQPQTGQGQQPVGAHGAKNMIQSEVVEKEVGGQSHPAVGGHGGAPVPQNQFHHQVLQPQNQTYQNQVATPGAEVGHMIPGKPLSRVNGGIGKPPTPKKVMKQQPEPAAPVGAPLLAAEIPLGKNIQIEAESPQASYPVVETQNQPQSTPNQQLNPPQQPPTQQPQQPQPQAQEQPTMHQEAPQTQPVLPSIDIEALVRLKVMEELKKFEAARKKEQEEKDRIEKERRDQERLERDMEIENRIKQLEFQKEMLEKENEENKKKIAEQQRLADEVQAKLKMEQEAQIQLKALQEAEMEKRLAEEAHMHAKRLEEERARHEEILKKNELERLEEKGRLEKEAEERLEKQKEEFLRQKKEREEAMRKQREEEREEALRQQKEKEEALRQKQLMEEALKEQKLKEEEALRQQKLREEEALRQQRLREEELKKKALNSARSPSKSKSLMDLTPLADACPTEHSARLKNHSVNLPESLENGEKGIGCQEPRLSSQLSRRTEATANQSSSGQTEVIDVKFEEIRQPKRPRGRKPKPPLYYAIDESEIEELPAGWTRSGKHFITSKGVKVQKILEIGEKFDAGGEIVEYQEAKWRRVTEREVRNHPKAHSTHPPSEDISDEVKLNKRTKRKNEELMVSDEPDNHLPKQKKQDKSRQKQEENEAVCPQRPLKTPRKAQFPDNLVGRSYSPTPQKTPNRKRSSGVNPKLQRSKTKPTFGNRSRSPMSISKNPSGIDSQSQYILTPNKSTSGVSAKNQGRNHQKQKENIAGSSNGFNQHSMNRRSTGRAQHTPRQEASLVQSRSRSKSPKNPFYKPFEGTNPLNDHQPPQNLIPNQSKKMSKNQYSTPALTQMRLNGFRPDSEFGLKVSQRSQNKSPYKSARNPGYASTNDLALKNARRKSSNPSSNGGMNYEAQQRASQPYQPILIKKQTNLNPGASKPPFSGLNPTSDAPDSSLSPYRRASTPRRQQQRKNQQRYMEMQKENLGFTANNQTNNSSHPHNQHKSTTNLTLNAVNSGRGGAKPTLLKYPVNVKDQNRNAVQIDLQQQQHLIQKQEITNHLRKAYQTLPARQPNGSNLAVDQEGVNLRVSCQKNEKSFVSDINDVTETSGFIDQGRMAPNTTLEMSNQLSTTLTHLGVLITNGGGAEGSRSPRRAQRGGQRPGNNPAFFGGSEHHQVKAHQTQGYYSNFGEGSSAQRANLAKNGQKIQNTQYANYDRTGYQGEQQKPISFQNNETRAINIEIDTANHQNQPIHLQRKIHQNLVADYDESLIQTATEQTIPGAEFINFNRSESTNQPNRSHMMETSSSQLFPKQIPQKKPNGLQPFDPNSLNQASLNQMSSLTQPFLTQQSINQSSLANLRQLTNQSSDQYAQGYSQNDSSSIGEIAHYSLNQKNGQKKAIQHGTSYNYTFQQEGEVSQKQVIFSRKNNNLNLQNIPQNHHLPPGMELGQDQQPRIRIDDSSFPSNGGISPRVQGQIPKNYLQTANEQYGYEVAQQSHGWNQMAEQQFRGKQQQVEAGSGRAPPGFERGAGEDDQFEKGFVREPPHIFSGMAYTKVQEDNMVEIVVPSANDSEFYVYHQN